jgi:cyclic pyranopterin phosphate synthase
MEADPVNPRPAPQSLWLRLSVTDRCQMRCFYCMPPEGASNTDPSRILTFEDILRFVRAVKCVRPLSKVRLTGGEPLIHRGIVHLIEMLSEVGVGDLALTTNGQELSALAADLKKAGLARVNISLDSLSETTYRALTRGGHLRPALQGIEAALAQGLTPVKLNVVVLRGWNLGEVARLAHFALRHGCQVRFLELMPIGPARRLHDRLFVSCAEVRALLGRTLELRPLQPGPGQTSRDFLAVDGRGRRGVIGFISPETQPFCAGCNRLRLTSDGHLLPCLAHGQGPCIRELLRDRSDRGWEALRKVIAAVVQDKVARTSYSTPRAMAAVGG